MGKEYAVFIDKSVGGGNIPEHLADQQIRRRVRDEYLRDSTVTIVLVGAETKRRKHVDWEIYSSMYDGPVNKKSGILVINLPSTDNGYLRAAHEGEKSTVYPDIYDWTTINTRSAFEEHYPCLPVRIIDSLVAGAHISVAPWSRITPETLEFLIDVAFKDRSRCKYDLSRSMRRANS